MDKFSDHNRVGKVYLVGSGPGNPGLLTVRARSLIDSCDVIVYDRLIGKILLDEIHANLESIYVGKTPGKESYSQEQINEILIEEANKGKRVVRLKGGDPFVFGRGAEEAIALRSASIPFEVVPGVTSAISAPGAAGIPVTNRGSASYFSVVTASENSSKEETDVDWKSLAQGKQTLIILMGSKKIDSISENLINLGRSPQTPASVIQSATLPEQNQVYGTLSTISEEARRGNISAPSVFIVGEVVSVAAEISQQNILPLYQKKILVTRSREQASALSALLSEMGAIPIEAPTIRCIPPANFDELDNAMSNLNRFDWVIYASTNSVEYFFQRLFANGLDVRSLAGLKIAAIGGSTKEALTARGVIPDLVPKNSSSKSLVDAFRLEGNSEDSVLLPRPKIATDILPKGLCQLGFNVESVEAYVTEIPYESGDYIKSLFLKGVDIVTFTSSSTVRNLFATGVTIPEDCVTACIGPMTAKTLQEFDVKPDVVADVHDVNGLAKSIVGYYQT